MAESLLLPVVRGVAGKAADALVQSVTGMWGVDDIRGKLERQLVAVQSKLLDAELKSETDPAVKLWMKALRAVAYEADDVLDDFQYEALRREAQNQIGESTTRKVLSYFTRHSPLLFRFTVSRNMNNVLKKIYEHAVGLLVVSREITGYLAGKHDDAASGGPAKPKPKSSRKPSGIESIWSQLLRNSTQSVQITPWALGILRLCGRFGDFWMRRTCPLASGGAPMLGSPPLSEYSVVCQPGGEGFIIRGNAFNAPAGEVMY